MPTCFTVCGAGVGVVRLVAAMISPYMPTLTARIMAQLGLPEEAAQLSDELIKTAATPQVGQGGVVLNGDHLVLCRPS